MRKAFILGAFLGLGLLTGAGCGKKQQADQGTVTKADTARTTPAVAAYYCPMDTDVVSDKPGECPKCGMDLVQKTVEKK